MKKGEGDRSSLGAFCHRHKVTGKVPPLCSRAIVVRAYRPESRTRREVLSANVIYTPVLKHGPRSPTWLRVLWCKNQKGEVKANEGEAHKCRTPVLIRFNGLTIER